MKSILKTYNKLRYNQTLESYDFNAILSDDNIHDFQRSSLLIQLYFKENKGIFEIKLFDFLKKQQNVDIIEYIENLTNDSIWENELLFNTAHKKLIGKELMDKFINAYVADKVDLNIVAAWLMLVNIKGLGKDDTVTMTKSMMQPDSIIDYRDFFENDVYFLRRYPTGGLSEKTALILPSLIAATAEYYPVKSNFLVARSLGYTGGTIDKLSSLSGFKAPDQPNEIIDILNKFGVVMSSTGNKVALADKKMYTLRSLTGTIESIPLIVFSIGSKQLSIPSDYLLMDIRYGDGAFMKNKSDANTLGEYLNEVLRQNNQQTNFMLTEANQPNGSSVGNILEVLEARDIMSNNFDTIFQLDSMHEQLEIVLKFYENMMQNYCPKSKDFWTNFGKNLIVEGKVLNKFYTLLEKHGVNENEINALKDNSYQLIESKHIYNLKSDKTGALKKIEYDNLGYFVNYEVNYDNLLDKSMLNGGGVILRVSLKDEVKEGQILATVYSTNVLSDNHLSELKSYFHVGEK